MKKVYKDKTNDGTAMMLTFFIAATLTAIAGTIIAILYKELIITSSSARTYETFHALDTTFECTLAEDFLRGTYNYYEVEGPQQVAQSSLICDGIIAKEGRTEGDENLFSLSLQNPFLNGGASYEYWFHFENGICTKVDLKKRVTDGTAGDGILSTLNVIAYNPCKPFGGREFTRSTKIRLFSQY